MKREVKISALSYAQNQTQFGSYIVVLSEANGIRKVPLIVRAQDAQSIAIRLEEMKPPRPLTHDFIKKMCDGFNVVCTEAYIYKVIEGIFYSRLTFNNGVDDVVVDCLVGDAIAISLVFDCPLYVSEEVFSICGIVTNDSGLVEAAPSTVIDEKKHIGIKDLEKLKEEAIAEENYELAAQLRDKIDNFNKDSDSK